MKVKESSRSTGKTNIVRHIRQKLNMTQEEFGDALGVHQVTVARWESGNRRILLTIPQFKALMLQMLKVGMKAEDLPDDL